MWCGVVAACVVLLPFHPVSCCLLLRNRMRPTWLLMRRLKPWPLEHHFPLEAQVPVLVFQLASPSAVLVRALVQAQPPQPPPRRPVTLTWRSWTLASVPGHAPTPPRN